MCIFLKQRMFVKMVLNGYRLHQREWNPCDYGRVAGILVHQKLHLEDEDILSSFTRSRVGSWNTRDGACKLFAKVPGASSRHGAPWTPGFVNMMRKQNFSIFNGIGCILLQSTSSCGALTLCMFLTGNIRTLGSILSVSDCSKGKCGYAWESILAVCFPNFPPYALYNPYVVGTW